MKMMIYQTMKTSRRNNSTMKRSFEINYGDLTPEAKQRLEKEGATFINDVDGGMPMTMVDYEIPIDPLMTNSDDKLKKVIVLASTLAKTAMMTSRDYSEKLGKFHNFTLYGKDGFNRRINYDDKKREKLESRYYAAIKNEIERLFSEWDKVIPANNFKDSVIFYTTLSALQKRGPITKSDDFKKYFIGNTPARKLYASLSKSVEDEDARVQVLLEEAFTEATKKYNLSDNSVELFEADKYYEFMRQKDKNFVKLLEKEARDILTDWANNSDNALVDFIRFFHAMDSNVSLGISRSWGGEASIMNYFKNLYSVFDNEEDDEE
jgi:hypothetical protein